MKTHLDAVLRKACENYSLQLLHVEIDSFGVRLRIRSTAHLSPSQVLARLKASSHRALIAEFPELRSSLGGPWSDSGYIRTIGQHVPGDAEDWLLQQRGLSPDAIARHRAQEATSHVG